MNLFSTYLNEILNIIHTTYPEAKNITGINVEFPRDTSHGDLSTNAAMVLKGKLNKNPREIAESLLPKIREINGIIDASIAGPGFINFNVENALWLGVISHIVDNPRKFASSDIGRNQKVNLEFVSANPTGPMHIGHARGAVYGDSLSRILSICGFDVTKEYYINDAGSQINTLIKSAFIRYQQTLGLPNTIQSGMYPGEYLITVGEKLKQKYSDTLVNIEEEEALLKIRQFVVDEMMDLIKEDLAELNIKHDVYTSEKNDLQDKGAIEEGIELLKSKGLIYKGLLEQPKGKSSQDWEAQEMTLFRSTDFGDDSDRAIIKSDGVHTYIAGDIAYHINKYRRGFNEMILVLGADHIGYIKRMKAIVSAISDNKATIEVAINQLVNLYKNGEPYKMSKRSGNFITVRDAIDEVGADILRFVMLTKKPDTVIDFDFDKVKEQSKENPVFYIQYASARASSILRKASEANIIANSDCNELPSETDKTLIKKLSEFPKIIEAAAITHEPHRICYYLYELATEFHSFWAAGSEDEKLRFIIEDDLITTNFRLNLANAVKLVITQGLDLIGVKALESM